MVVAGKRKHELVAECKKCNKIRNHNVRRGNKLILINECGGRCIKCNYNKCLNALTFHHINQEDKKFDISDRLHYKMSMLREEVKKCILVCQNCHSEIHENEGYGT